MDEFIIFILAFAGACGIALGLHYMVWISGFRAGWKAYWEDNVKKNPESGKEEP